MCGISGAFNREKGIHPAAAKAVEVGNTLQKHRGPDDRGLFVNEISVLGHVRLSIIDLSKDGHQPFESSDGRYVMVYNGEIYNYIELRTELEERGFVFRTKTDTEVLLAAFIADGPSCLQKFNGMFAFAILDKKERTLFLARDRFGVKPLYYVFHEGTLFFASEIKVLRSIPGIRRKIDNNALFDYLCFNRTDIFDETFDAEIKRLPKGHYALVDREGFTITNWWDPRTYSTNTIDANEEEISAKIEELMCSAVALRMRSDVPVGSCLSGGLDSSIIVGIVYRDFSPKEYLTFTASFPGFHLDESAYIDLLAKKYPFRNIRTFPDAKGALKHLKEFVHIHDDPVSSPTFYSQYEVMRLARENGVTVLLDGQGGDEDFAGYHYFHGFHFTGLLRRRRYFRLIQEVAASILRKQDREAFETFAFQTISPALRRGLLARTLPHVKRDFFYGHVDQSRIFQEFFAAKDLNESIVNHYRYKLEHLLRAEDRNSMAFHIETRLPFLDYRLVEFLLTVPEHLKIRKGESKFLQKRALGAYTIPEILSRKDKIGFGTPGEEWMRTPEWEKLTEENYRFCCEVFPEVFVPSATLKYNLYERWKINQLATWYREQYP